MAAEPTTLRAAIEAANQELMSAVARGDAAGMAALYTPDGILLPAHRDFVSGMAAIQAFWGSVTAMGVTDARLETVELEAHGDTAYEVGRYSLRGGAGQVLDEGKYIVLWRRDQGQWKLHRDIWNTSLPAPA